jgi:hypothetical protein
MKTVFKVTSLSSGPENHFYGYYGINPWDPSIRYHLALETDFHERRPEPGDSVYAVICIRAGRLIAELSALTRSTKAFGRYILWMFLKWFNWQICVVLGDLLNHQETERAGFLGQ